VSTGENAREVIATSNLLGHFRDRAEAGRVLAVELATYAGRSDVVLLALPRGGVPVAYEVARALGAPLDVFVVRKLGVPGHEELAMGALATGGVLVLNDDVVEALRITRQEIDDVAERERAELVRREREYRGDRPALDVRGRTAILVDDGLATGSTMRAAAVALRRLGPQRLVVAVPVGSPDTCRGLRAEVDEVVCAFSPHPFYAVGFWYADFAQTTDDEVRDFLARAANDLAAPDGRAGAAVRAA
jgi:predicted phosphoribosyltransferase